mmetsp:Transcript_7596/g.14308  ORF Transcript_7596/g.14308 Transcript_7596/m.14308 type:complete len:216 (+) Transcript_7596:1961-2608(+)
MLRAWWRRACRMLPSRCPNLNTASRGVPSRATFPKPPPRCAPTRCPRSTTESGWGLSRSCARCCRCSNCTANSAQEGAALDLDWTKLRLTWQTGTNGLSGARRRPPSARWPGWCQTHCTKHCFGCGTRCGHLRRRRAQGTTLLRTCCIYMHAPSSFSPPARSIAHLHRLAFLCGEAKSIPPLEGEQEAMILCRQCQRSMLSSTCMANSSSGTNTT